jgi:hypothetical protein
MSVRKKIDIHRPRYRGYTSKFLIYNQLSQKALKTQFFSGKKRPLFVGTAHAHQNTGFRGEKFQEVIQNIFHKYLTQSIRLRFDYV